MAREQEQLRFLGFFGIFKESLNITTSNKRTFSKITLSIIFPLSITKIFMIRETIHYLYALNHTQIGSQKYSRISDILSFKPTTLNLLLKIAVFIIFVLLSLLSTSAVVYTIECIYTAKEVTFKKVVKAVPKVWKRLIVTFIWSFVIAYAYSIVALLVLVPLVVTLSPSFISLIIAVICLVIYLVGFIYIDIISCLASVISVLEDVYGIQAMLKGKDLIKGKTGVCSAILLILSLCFSGVQLGFEVFLVGDSVWGKMWYGFIRFVLLSMLILFGLVIKTVIYFVCKSYHHENINKSLFSDNLEVYSEDSLSFKDVHLEHFEV